MTSKKPLSIIDVDRMDGKVIVDFSDHTSSTYSAAEPGSPSPEPGERT